MYTPMNGAAVPDLTVLKIKFYYDYYFRQLLWVLFISPGDAVLYDGELSRTGPFTWVISVLFVDCC